MDRTPENERKINIVGAGLAGLSAALTLSEAGLPSRLISVQTSERAQSNLAEGGINACLNVMGEEDHVREHFTDTVRGGCDLADPNMAAGLCLAAPGIIRELIGYGVPFQREKGKLVQRNFGGQKKKRTAYVKSSTGKMIMAAMIDAVRRYECEGLVERLSHHEFRQLVIKEGICSGVLVHDKFRGEDLVLSGTVILAAGGMNGMFPGQTTGSTANTGDAAAVLFAQGVEMANLEMVQYHPTTVQIAGKRMLISEAARGEGGRLFYYGDGTDRAGSRGDERPKVRFMEEKYGEKGNLMPRDVVSREMAICGRQVFLDLMGLPDAAWEKKLSDLREEIIHYLAIDPKQEPVPVAPGIHFFMGGILIDEEHRTNVPGLYAAGECACGYHGANRLGGNSLLAAIYGGKKAASEAAADQKRDQDREQENPHGEKQGPASVPEISIDRAAGEFDEEVSQILIRSLPVLRCEAQLEEGLAGIRNLKKRMKERNRDCGNTLPYCRVLLAEAVMLSAVKRKESRGAHFVREYPERSEAFRKTTAARCVHGNVEIEFKEIPALRDSVRLRLEEEGDTRGRI